MEEIKFKLNTIKTFKDVYTLDDGTTQEFIFTDKTYDFSFFGDHSEVFEQKQKQDLERMLEIDRKKEIKKQNKLQNKLDAEKGRLKREAQAKKTPVKLKSTVKLFKTIDDLLNEINQLIHL
jgi:hypothetical protein